MKIALLLVCSLLLVAGLFAQTDTKAVFATKAGAIKGYDPVAYFTQKKPVKGQPDISFEWNGAVWHFASTGNRTLFQENPEKYAPQYGGWCAYGWSQGYPAKIEPEAWSILDGKLYLNYSLKVQKTWNEDKPGYIKKADVNWPSIVDKK